MKLTDVQKRFILHWGEIGAWSGINRSHAQIFALLYLSPKALNAEEICETLSLSRSNVSIGIRELQSWRLIRVSHVIGDRRDHFETLKDVWEMFALMMEERRRREFDPTRHVLKSCLDEADRSESEDPQTKKAIREMLDFFESMTVFHDQMKRIPSKTMKELLHHSDKIGMLLAMVPEAKE